MIAMPPGLFVCDITVSFQLTVLPDLSPPGASIRMAVLLPVDSIGLLNAEGTDGTRLGADCGSRISFNDVGQAFPGSHPRDGSTSYADVFRPQDIFGFGDIFGVDTASVSGEWILTAFGGGVSPNMSADLACWRLTIRTSTTPVPLQLRQKG